MHTVAYMAQYMRPIAHIQDPSTIREKKNQMHIFKGFEDQSDTYHDT
jgi:hypothetical protein